MTRKKVKLAYISNDSARKATFKKRKKGFLKKMYELTTLCEIEACAIIYSPYEAQPEAWPNAPGAQRVLSKFRKMPEMEKSKKMVNQEAFVRQRINKTTEHLKKQQKENREKEITKLMHQCLGGSVGIHNLSLMDLNDLGWLIDQNLKEIYKRNDALKKQAAARAARRQAVVEAMPPPPPPLPPALPQTEEVGVHDGDSMMQQSQTGPQGFDNMNQLLDPQEPMPMRGTWFMDLMGAMGPNDPLVAGFGGGASGSSGGFGGGVSGSIVFGGGPSGNGGFGSGASGSSVVFGGGPSGSIGNFGGGVSSSRGFGGGGSGSGGGFGGGAIGSGGGFGGRVIGSGGSFGGGVIGSGGGFGSGGSSSSGGFGSGASSSSGGGFGSGASGSGGGGIAGDNMPMTFADYSSQNLWSNAFFP